MHVFYRLSDGSYKKERFKNATKQNCLRNFLDNFWWPGGHASMTIYADNVQDETWKWLTELIDEENLMVGLEKDPIWGIKVMRSNAGSSAASFRLVFEEALKLSDDEFVYFVEDDYCHLKLARGALTEGLTKADYVTLYNHPDKYLPASKGGNMYIGDDAAESTKVTLGKFSYWALTNSTTMTFAASVQTLKTDEEIWRRHTNGTYPQDFRAFIDLRQKGKSLVQPIPTFATHCEPAWAASLVGTGVKDWEEVLNGYSRTKISTL